MFVESQELSATPPCAGNRGPGADPGRDATPANKLWRDAGAVAADTLREEFGRILSSPGADSTCPKSWRHTFATLLQDANVDPLIRQQVMGHSPTLADVFGVTATHTRPETRKE